MLFPVTFCFQSVLCLALLLYVQFPLLREGRGRKRFQGLVLGPDNLHSCSAKRLVDVVPLVSHGSSPVSAPTLPFGASWESTVWALLKPGIAPTVPRLRPRDKYSVVFTRRAIARIASFSISTASHSSNPHYILKSACSSKNQMAQKWTPNQDGS